MENSPPHTKRAPLKRLNLRNWKKNHSEFWQRPFLILFYFFWRSPNFGRKKPLNFGFRPKNHSEFWRRSFFSFFFGDHLILSGKNLWIRISAEKSLWILAKTFFFFFLEITWFWAAFEFPSFPRHFVSIFGQTVWNWFKINKNSSQGRLHTSHSFKIAPPFSKSWLRACVLLQQKLYSYL